MMMMMNTLFLVTVINMYIITTRPHSLPPSQRQQSSWYRNIFTRVIFVPVPS